jgi:hypothetical protein
VVSKLEARVERSQTQKKKKRKRCATGCWPRGDQTHAGASSQFLVEAARSAESGKARPDADFGMSGHFLRASRRCGPDAAPSLFIDRCWWCGTRAERVSWPDAGRVRSTLTGCVRSRFHAVKSSLEMIWLHADQRLVNWRSASGQRLTAALTISWLLEINVAN